MSYIEIANQVLDFGVNAISVIMLCLSQNLAGRVVNQPPHVAGNR
jgi:hypothetical protein